MKNVMHIQIDPNLKRAAQIRALQAGKSVSEYVTSVLLEDVEAHGADKLLDAGVEAEKEQGDE